MRAEGTTASKRVADEQLTRSVLRVGEGRGFVVRLGADMAVITAAHCLPCLPVCHTASSVYERTYQALIGPLGAEPRVCAECLFADPIADIAVLGMPDSQELRHEADAYRELVTSVRPLAVAHAPAQRHGYRRFGNLRVPYDTPSRGFVRLLSLECQWIEAEVERRIGSLSLEPKELIVSGMTGSPILSPAGEAVGVVAFSEQNPALMDCLSARLLQAIVAAQAAGS
jgi:hypothetical protein